MTQPSLLENSVNSKDRQFEYSMEAKYNLEELSRDTVISINVCLF